jgi:hypothetical protein
MIVSTSLCEASILTASEGLRLASRLRVAGADPAVDPLGFDSGVLLRGPAPFRDGRDRRKAASLILIAVDPIA